MAYEMIYGDNEQTLMRMFPEILEHDGLTFEEKSFGYELVSNDGSKFGEDLGMRIYTGPTAKVDLVDYVKGHLDDVRVVVTNLSNPAYQDDINGVDAFIQLTKAGYEGQYRVHSFFKRTRDAQLAKEVGLNLVHKPSSLTEIAELLFGMYQQDHQ